MWCRCPLGEDFHVKRLTLKSSQVGHVAASQRARWDHARRMQLALSLLNDPVLDVLISGESDFDDLPAVMARLATSPRRRVVSENSLHGQSLEPRAQLKPTARSPKPTYVHRDRS